MEVTIQSPAGTKHRGTLESVAGDLYFMIFSPDGEVSANASKLNHVPSNMQGPQLRTGV